MDTAFFLKRTESSSVVFFTVFPDVGLDCATSAVRTHIPPTDTAATAFCWQHPARWAGNNSAIWTTRHRVLGTQDTPPLGASHKPL